MSPRKIRFDDKTPALEFDEWIEPGYTKPHNHISRKTEHPSPQADTRLFYQSFGSGSSGNCCYVGTAAGGFLVDAGIKADVVEKALAANGIPMSMVKGIVLTHDHTDHVKYVYTLLRTYRHIKLFCTNRVLNGLLRKHNVSKRIKEYHVPIFKEIPFRMMNLLVTAFEVHHDGSDNMGFSISYENKNFVLATDLGEISDRARHYMSQANYLVIEANYDARMLREGPYPEYLKARIATANGHMDNAETAAFLAEIAGNGLEYIFLCHISKDNNTPEKALETVGNALRKKGFSLGSATDTLEERNADLQLAALPRFDPTRWFVFR